MGSSWFALLNVKAVIFEICWGNLVSRHVQTLGRTLLKMVWMVALFRRLSVEQLILKSNYVNNSVKRRIVEYIMVDRISLLFSYFFFFFKFAEYRFKGGSKDITNRHVLRKKIGKKQTMAGWWGRPLTMFTMKYGITDFPLTYRILRDHCFEYTK